MRRPRQHSPKDTAGQHPESLAEHPATMTHADVDPGAKQRLGISDALVRLSVGVENPEDIVDDLKQALSSGGGTDQRRS